MFLQSDGEGDSSDNLDRDGDSSDDGDLDDNGVGSNDQLKRGQVLTTTYVYDRVQRSWREIYLK